MSTQKSFLTQMVIAIVVIIFFLNFINPALYYTAIYFFNFFMEKETDTLTLHIFNADDKDFIRLSEQYHESLLQKELLSYGILVDFDKISPHGLKN